ncbi:MAG TPA: fused MFS/spermidine synthase, partial [Longimicrobiaceae bacterium]|nr:fused MFS/spermidine synthase [Longimicrobiaceae bacterium]
MDASSPERRRPGWPVVLRAVLVGLALGVVATAGGALVLFRTEGALAASAAVIATFAVALGAGLWAGVPPDEEERVSLAGRWLFAGISVGAAGVFATVLGILSRLGRQGEALRVLGLLFLVAVPVYAIGFLLPALIGWAEGEEDPLGEGGEGPARRALGAVAVGVLAGFAVGALASGFFLIPKLDPGPLLLGAAALLTSPLLFPRAQRAGPEERVVYETETPYGTLRVVETTYSGERQPDRTLYQDDEIESGELVRSGAPTFAYVAAGERWLAEVARRGDAYLFLGGGAYTLPRRVAERDPTARITVVELDPEVTRVAYRWFGLRPEHGVASVHGDARAAVDAWAAGGAEGFDRIYVDVYGGGEALPHSLVSVEALARMRGLLRPGGTLALNVIGTAAGEGSLRLWSTLRTACEVFPSTELYLHLGRDYPERQNFLLACAAEAEHRFPERAGTFARWPRAEWPRPAGTTVFRDLAPRGERSAAPSGG